MVLNRLAFLSLAALLAALGCKHSLFDNNIDNTGGPDGGGSGSGDGNTNVPSSCPQGCLADAAADFDGSPMGMGNRWRYVEDTRNRTWTDMTASGGGFVGTVLENTIAPCGSEPACAALPGALRVSTAGATTAADPALGWTSTMNQVIQLSVRVHVPTGAGDHQVRLYRNSREDVLFTQPATAGMTVEQAITVDALDGDRFFVALAPTGFGAADLALHFYINATGQVFPQQCQLAVSFAAASGNGVANACGSPVSSEDYNTGPIAPVLGAGPFAEMGMAADLPFDHYYETADQIVRTGDTTTQLWMRHDQFMTSYGAWAFSDVDLNNTGGLEIFLFQGTGSEPMLEVATCTLATQTTLDFEYVDVQWPNDAGWHFVRVVHTNGQVRVCVDGVRLGSFAAPAGTLASSFHPYIGKNVVWTPAGAFWDGGIDDVRSFSTALPCE